MPPAAHSHPACTLGASRERGSPAPAAGRTREAANRYVRTRAAGVSAGCAPRSCGRSGERRCLPGRTGSAIRLEILRVVRTCAVSSPSEGLGFPARVSGGPTWDTGDGVRRPQQVRSPAGGLPAVLQAHLVAHREGMTSLAATTGEDLPSGLRLHTGPETVVLQSLASAWISVRRLHWSSRSRIGADAPPI